MPRPKKVASPSPEEEAKKLSGSTDPVSEPVPTESVSESLKPDPAPKVEEKDFGTLGRLGIRIMYLGKKEVRGRSLNEVHLADGTTYLLSDEDLENQHNK